MQVGPFEVPFTSPPPLEQLPLRGEPPGSAYAAAASAAMAGVYVEAFPTVPSGEQSL
jgi:hypothetical protein